MKIIKYEVGNNIFIDLTPNREEFEALEEGFVIAEDFLLGTESVSIGLKYNGAPHAFSKKQVEESLQREC